MTAKDAPVLVRTRLAVERAPGRNVILPTGDVLEVLRHAVGRAQAVDLDGLDGAVPAPRVAEDGPTAPVAPGRPDVRLTSSRGDGERLARAAWDTQRDGRKDPWRPWDELGEEQRSALVSMAVRAISAMVGDGTPSP